MGVRLAQRGAGHWRCQRCTSPPANQIQALGWLRTTLYGSPADHPSVKVNPPAEEWELQEKQRADCIQELCPSEKVIKVRCLTQGSQTRQVVTRKMDQHLRKTSKSRSAEARRRSPQPCRHRTASPCSSFLDPAMRHSSRQPATAR